MYKGNEDYEVFITYMTSKYDHEAVTLYSYNFVFS
jgi:hypothetical protein